METEKKVRTRKSPEARANEILDQAEAIIALEGVDALSFDRLSKAANVSKSLVYSYFDSITELLRALLKREMKNLRERQIEAAKDATTIEQLVRRVTHAYLIYIEQRGGLIYRIESEPSVALGGPTRYSRDASVKHLASMMSEMFDLPESIVVPAMDISYGIPDAAGRYLADKAADRVVVEEITVTMLLACIDAIRKSYDVKFRTIPTQ